MSKRFLSEETMFNFLSSTYIARLGDKSASWWDLDAGGELETHCRANTRRNLKIGWKKL